MVTTTVTSAGRGSCLFSFMLTFGIFALVGGIFFIVFVVMEQPEMLAPIFCPEGNTIETESFRTYDGTSVEFYCVDSEGVKDDVTGKIVMALIAGIMGAIFIFIMAIFLFGAIFARRASKGLQDSIVSIQHGGESYVLRNGRLSNVSGSGMDADIEGDYGMGAAKPKRSGGIEERLETLQRAYDQGLITREEYEKKKAEILKDL
ncbi:hypothetical protein MASR2M15_24030 [Anaerolineales bacterium]